MRIIFLILLMCSTGFAFAQDERGSDPDFINAPSGDGGELGQDPAARGAEEGDEREGKPDTKHK